MAQNIPNINSVDIENQSYTCDDGNTYPLPEGLETLPTEQIKEIIGNAYAITNDILSKINENYG